jgi:hypothetical protein
MKTCFKCGETKLFTDFYKHSKMADGYLGKCKACTKADVAAHRADNIEQVREYDRARGFRGGANHTAKYKAAYPKRRSAQVALGNAVRAGRLQPLPCLECGAKAEAHHPDYDRPLDVIWLCPPHHKQTHAMVRNV